MDATCGAKRVLIVDDHALLRKGLRSVLEQHGDLHVVGEAGNGVEAVHYARTLKPHVIIMDIRMPYMDGVQATRLIKEEHPHVLVIGLSMMETPMMRDALLEAGGFGYLHKAAAAEDLYLTICRCLGRASSTW